MIAIGFSHTEINNKRTYLFFQNDPSGPLITLQTCNTTLSTWSASAPRYVPIRIPISRMRHPISCSSGVPNVMQYVWFNLNDGWFELELNIVRRVSFDSLSKIDRLDHGSHGGQLRVVWFFGNYNWNNLFSHSRRLVSGAIWMCWDRWMAVSTRQATKQIWLSLDPVQEGMWLPSRPPNWDWR